VISRVLDNRTPVSKGGSSTGRIIKNVSSGFLAQAWTVVLGLVALPILVRGLGPDRYGLLALALAIIGIAAVADFGVGRAASKYIAEEFERNDFRFTQFYVSTAFTVSLLMGAIGTVVLLVVIPLLVRYTFNITPALRHEATVALAVAALGLIPVLLRILFDGILAGCHRIALLNIVNMAANTAKIGLSVAVILLGRSLLAVVSANVLVCTIQALILGIYAFKQFRGVITFRPRWNRAVAHQLLGLGMVSTLSWILANVVFLYADRFIIAIYLPLMLTGYYTIAFDITSKEWYISNSISQAFFPVFSGKSVVSEGELRTSYLQAMKAMAVTATGAAMLLIVFGRELLTYWLAPDVAAHSTTAFAILAIGMLFSCYIAVPYTAILASSAKRSVLLYSYSLAIVLHVASSLALVKVWGLTVVAVSFTVAQALVFVILSFWVSDHLVKESFWRSLGRSYGGSWFAATLMGVFYWFAVKAHLQNLLMVVTAGVVGYAFYLIVGGGITYTSSERQYVFSRFRRFWDRSQSSLVSAAGED